MEPAPYYLQTAAANMLYALSPAPALGWAGYWPSSAADFGDTVTIDQVWMDVGGVYVFAAKAPIDVQAFTRSLKLMIPQISRARLLRVLWIADPNLAPACWQIQCLLACANAGSWSVARQAMLSVGGYALMVPTKTPLTQLARGYGIAIGGAPSFVATGGVFPVAPGTCAISLAAPYIGTLAATLQIAGDGPSDAFTRLGVALRYVFPADGKRPDATATLNMPILAQDGQAFSLHLSLFPGVADEPALSALAFFAAGASGPGPTLASFLRTPQGYGTTLTPIPATASLAGARLVFGSSPRSRPNPKRLPGAVDLHLCPDGPFALTTLTPAHALKPGPCGTVDRVLLGAAGTEYVGLTAQSGNIALFAGGAPAYAPSPEIQAGAGIALLTADATTAAVTILPRGATGTALTYFSQPREAPLFQAAVGSYLDFLELPAATMPVAAATLPLGLYAGIDPTRAAQARALETAVLAPARRAAARPLAASVPGISMVTGATPRGLVVDVSSDLIQWQSVVVANMPRMAPVKRAFTSVGAEFQAALQADQVFFVVADPAKISTCPALSQASARCTSVTYRLYARSLAILQSQGVAQATISALDAGLGPLGYPSYPNKTAFVAIVQQYAPNLAAGDLAKILAIAGQLTIDIDGWVFQISPDAWRTGDNPSAMIVKYCERTLEDLLADRAAWGFIEAAGNAPERTQERILGMVAQAKAAHDTGKDDAYARFYVEIASNPAWNGFLFLDVPVAISELPAELRFVAAGIDSARFFAHHLAIGVTPMAAGDGTLSLGQSAISGLIDYTDLVDQVLDSNVSFAFKTMRLTARFANSVLVEFRAQAQLMINRLFDAVAAKLEPTHGNNLVLDGGFQRQNGKPVYSFVLEGANDYRLAHSALAQVSVASVQIQTSASSDTDTKVVVRFVLSGALRFLEFPDFDLFSYGQPLAYTVPPPADADSALIYAGLAVSMGFDLGLTTDKKFAFIANDLSFDSANSQARMGALARLFPVRLASFVVGAGSAGGTHAAAGPTPEDLGFAGIVAPLDAVPMSSPWYGLVYTIDLGTLGALSGSKALTMSLLAAWSIGANVDSQPVYLGLKMPNARPLGVDLPLQGVLSLGFRSFDFVASGPRASRKYMLRMRRFGLSALGMSFPPGNLDVFLFGGPDPSGKLAWYGAYVPNPSSKAAPPSHAPRLTDAQRAAQPVRLSRPERERRNGRRSLPPNTGM
jgi:hypothetical protein